MVVRIFNPSLQETKANQSLWIQSRPGLCGKFRDTQGFIERLSQNKIYFCYDCVDMCVCM